VLNNAKMFTATRASETQRVPRSTRSEMLLMPFVLPQNLGLRALKMALVQWLGVV
jgi:hypothetical protein